MSWRNRMRSGGGAAYPSANSAVSADSSAERAFGTIGTIGTRVETTPEPAGETLSALLALTARGCAAPAAAVIEAPAMPPDRALVVPPRPVDVAERAAIIEEATGCPRAEAEARALAEHDLDEWPALADAHGATILAELAALPPATSDAGRRLIEVTRRFVETAHWREAIRHGWSLIELFGCHATAPLGRLDGQGLVTGLALSRLNGPRLDAVHEDHAVIAYRSGSRLRHRRFHPGLDGSVLWWTCPALIGDHNAQARNFAPRSRRACSGGLDAPEPGSSPTGKKTALAEVAA